MKPIHATILEGADNGIFSIRILERPYFSTEFHFHTECQITYILESEGRRIVGDSVDFFNSGELTFLGSDIPHVWHNDIQSLPKKAHNTGAKSLALFFHPDKLVHLLSELVDVQKLSLLFKIAQRGMVFFGETKEGLKKLLVKMTAQKSLAQLITMLEIFELLTTTKEYSLLASTGYKNTYQAKDSDRMDKVFKHIFCNFKSDIKLEEMASIANMNQQAFCRYFKSRTQKTLVEFVNNIRISHACKLISDGDYSITALAYECGFQSLSNFNRFFKEVKGLTPREYRKQVTVL